MLGDAGRSTFNYLPGRKYKTAMHKLTLTKSTHICLMQRKKVREKIWGGEEGLPCLVPIR